MNKYNDKNFESAYNSYFGIKSDTQHTPKENKEENSIQQTNSGFKFQSNTNICRSDEIPTNSRMSSFANGNISSINELGETLRKLLNAAWGDDWGILGPIFTKGEQSESIVFPQITYNTYSREISEKSPIKPKLTDYIKEVVDGKETGDAFAIYRQLFDCILEFDIWGRNTYESYSKAEEFELLLGQYTWFLKEAGISEIAFLKEIPPKESANYIEGLCMKPLLFFVRLERIQSIRTSILDKINYKLNSSNTVNNTEDIYKQSKIKYNLD